MNPPPNVLLVDDSENDLILMRIAFKKAGFGNPPQEAHNGEEAIAYLQGEGAFGDRLKFPLPTVMLLDLNMPMKDGFDVLDWLRAQPWLKHLPVFVLSASMQSEDVARAFAAGASSFLVKPGTMEELIRLVGSLKGWLEFNHYPPLRETGANQAPVGGVRREYTSGVTAL